MSSGVHDAARVSGPSGSTLKVRQSCGKSGSACRLTDSTGGVRLAGVQIAPAGVWNRSPPHIQTTSVNSVSVYVPAASASVLVRVLQQAREVGPLVANPPAGRRSQGITRPARSSSLTPGAGAGYKGERVRRLAME
jgi:hypothetical protein